MTQPVKLEIFMRKKMFILVSLITTLGLLCGCGNKGPLYMPGEESAAEKKRQQQWQR